MRGGMERGRDSVPISWVGVLVCEVWVDGRSGSSDKFVCTTAGRRWRSGTES